jgi:hypothetical protein
MTLSAWAVTAFRGDEKQLEMVRLDRSVLSRQCKGSLGDVEQNLQLKFVLARSTAGDYQA